MGRLLLRIDDRVVRATDRPAVARTLRELFDHGAWAEFDNESFRLMGQEAWMSAAAELRRLEREEPEDGWIRALQARLALGVGLHEEALRLAREAERIEPASPAVLRTLSEVLSVGRRGGRYGLGMDRRGALEAVDRALAIDPASDAALRHRIHLLALDQRGQVGGDEADAEEALELLRRTLSRGDHSEDELYFELLWQQGLDEELIRESERSMSPLRLAAIARSRGAEEALLALERERSGQFEQRLAGAVLELFKAREYPLARALAARGHVPGWDPVSQFFATTRKRDEIPVRFDHPIDLFIELMAHSAGAKVRTNLEQIGLSEEMLRFYAGDFETEASEIAGLEDAVLDGLVDMTSAKEREVPGVGWLVSFQAEQIPPFTVLFRKAEARWYFHEVYELEAQIGKAWSAWEAGDGERARGWLEVAFQVHGGDISPMLDSAIRSRMGGSMEELGVAIALATPDFAKEQARVVSILERTVTQPAKSREDALEVAFRFMNALLAAGRHDDALSIIDVLEEGRTYPDAESAQRDRFAVLFHAGRFPTIEALGKEILERDPTSMIGWEMLSQAAWRQGDLRGYRTISLEMAEAGIRVDRALNNAAWVGVFLGAEEEDVRMAERAVAAKSDEEANLDTLAVLLAETGKVDRAVRAIERLVEIRGEEGDSPSMIFARARLAEVLGFTAAARELYGRVSNAPGIDDLTPLARKRQAALQ